jgi:hypothetical protein
VQPEQSRGGKVQMVRQTEVPRFHQVTRGRRDRELPPEVLRDKNLSRPNPLLILLIDARP